MNLYIEYVFILKNLFQNLFGAHYPTEIIKLIILILYKPIQIVAGIDYTILINKKTYVWGKNNYGQLGLGDIHDRTSPQELPGCSRISSVHLSQGKGGGPILFPEGTVGLHPNFNKVGDELLLPDIKLASCGASHIVALTFDDTIYVWGYNTNGELGLGDTNNKNTPRKLMLSSSRIKSIVCGGYHTVALTFSSKIYVWGCGRDGQLGLGDMNNRNTPHELILADVKSVSCGGYHTIALISPDTLYVWGDNAEGQLGLGDYYKRSSPQKLKFSLSDIKSISCGGFYTIALASEGAFYSWGYNNSGQLGLGDKNKRNIPHKIIVSNIKSINCGCSHTVAVTTSDTLYVWGYNLYGQLGLGDNENRTSPQELTLKNINAIACSWSHYTIAITNTNDAYVWGNNDNGQLGLGDSIDRNIPCRLNFDFDF